MPLYKTPEHIFIEYWVPLWLCSLKRNIIQLQAVPVGQQDDFHMKKWVNRLGVHFGNGMIEGAVTQGSTMNALLLRQIGKVFPPCYLSEKSDMDW